jgi:hypothetical protein
VTLAAAPPTTFVAELGITLGTTLPEVALPEVALLELVAAATFTPVARDCG